jgi:hypothetical protein
MSTHAERVRGLAEHDGTFRRLIQTVREQRVVSTGRPGRPPKNRIATTGHFARYLHEQMKALAEARTDAAGRLVSVSDLYNEAAAQMITDLHALLGDDVRLPAGAVSLTAVLGLRELVNRPLHTPLRDLPIEAEDQQRTTLYFDRPVWEALIEMSMRFGLQMRRAIHVHRLIEMAAAWYMAGFKTALD